MYKSINVPNIILEDLRPGSSDPGWKASPTHQAGNSTVLFPVAPQFGSMPLVHLKTHPWFFLHSPILCPSWVPIPSFSAIFLFKVLQLFFFHSIPLATSLGPRPLCLDTDKAFLTMFLLSFHESQIDNRWRLPQTPICLKPFPVGGPSLAAHRL